MVTQILELKIQYVKFQDYAFMKFKGYFIKANGLYGGKIYFAKWCFYIGLF